MRSEWVRRALLWVHAESLVFTGALIIIGGPARLNPKSFTYMHDMPWWPYSWGAWAIAAGSTLALGLVVNRLAIKLLALLLIGSWYGFVTFNFLLAALYQGSALYPISVYACLTSLALVHVLGGFDEMGEHKGLARAIRASREDIDSHPHPTQPMRRKEDWQ